MPEVHPEQATLDRLDALRVGEESSDELVTEFIDISEAEEMTLARGGDQMSPE